MSVGWRPKTWIRRIRNVAAPAESGDKCQHVANRWRIVIGAYCEREPDRWSRHRARRHEHAERGILMARRHANNRRDRSRCSRIIHAVTAGLAPVRPLRDQSIAHHWALWKSHLSNPRADAIRNWRPGHGLLRHPCSSERMGRAQCPRGDAGQTLGSTLTDRGRQRERQPCGCWEFTPYFVPERAWIRLSRKADSAGSLVFRSNFLSVIA